MSDSEQRRAWWAEYQSKEQKRLELARARAAERREKARKAKRDAAMARLREWGLSRGDTIYCTLMRVSSLGMSRVIKLHLGHDGYMLDISELVSQVCGLRLSKLGGVCIVGSGMDMGFAIVYDLSSHLFASDGEDCGSGAPTDRRGGYALLHRWL